MRHRRDHADVVTFDLDPELDPGDHDHGRDHGHGVSTAALDGGATSEDAALAEVQPSVVVRVLRRVVRAVAAWPRRRKLVVAGTVLGLAVAGSGIVVTVDVLRDRALAARILTAPGGVTSLADAPTQRWRTELSQPQPVAVMDGLLVVAEVESRSEIRDGDWVTLHALDPLDGSVRWSTEVEGAHECDAAAGAWASWSARIGTASTVVCLTGGTGSGVTVVSADGRIVAERALEGHTDAETVLAAPGAVLRVYRVGTADDARYERQVLGEDFTARDMVVRMEDAVTGDVRWETTVRGATAPAGTAVATMHQCTQWSGDRAVAESVSDENVAYSWSLGSGRVWFDVCGVNATIDLHTGEILRSVDPFGPTNGGWDPGIVAVDGDGYAARLPLPTVLGSANAEETTRVWREDGTVVGDVAGSLVAPMVTDGSAPQMLLTYNSSGLAAFDPADATALWTLDGTGGWPVARTERVLVVHTGNSYVAVDPRTGQERWEAPMSSPAPGDPGNPPALVGAFTDGRRLMLVEARDGGLVREDSTSFLVTRALDLSTGATLWTQERTAAPPIAIGGRLYEFDATGVAGLG